MRTRLLIPALLSAFVLLLPAPGAHAQATVNRCVGADGQTVFSDRRCEDLGTTTRMPPAALRDGETGLYRYGCPRRLSELVGLLRTAVETHDVNRLSSLYLWGDVSDATANRVLSQLEAIADRTLVDIAPMYPAETAEAYVPVAAPDMAESTGGYVPPDNSAATAMVEAPLAPATRPRPWGLRLEQVMANGSTPARTVLRLRRQYNCFWVSF
ncbi:hypothetical protein ARC20_13865 [Stenotrophomonas panacihumi]|uniref:DUF4124 domain-containing protein n=1 Tax=Stenotrophomonas panacihumi TaxID=676599 RepID=A0A0R0A253_9GAMM|nr:DUF4124 domain-containing protein [Stenotrophomonas panacihumi]KRG39254.1 hypothetical protein ARC20_13865 [Stenotrophomonas panacihumi]PTN55253.1 DUF4124 domain-containing protein [Stenotrophomonas panacihumi]